MTQHRARVHAATLTEIKQLARQLMATQGTAALSLRAIAEQMGFTPQALYRYFPSRDALVTALIVDACTDLAAALEAARDAVPPEREADRLLAVLLTYRQWAITHPVEYTLIYSKPIPDYEPPAAVIEPAVQRIPTVVIGLLLPPWQEGRLTTLPDYGPLPAELEQQFVRLREAVGYTLPTHVLHNVLIIWSRLHGLIMLEIFGHLHQSVSDPGALYRFEVSTILKNVGLRPNA